jgi:hypothetical protein
LYPAGGHLGEGDGAKDFFFLVAGFFVGVAFFVAVGLADTEGEAFAVTFGLGVGVGLFVAARLWLGIRANSNANTRAVRLIGRSI